MGIAAKPREDSSRAESRPTATTPEPSDRTRMWPLEGQLAADIALGIVAVVLLFSAEWRWVGLTYLIAMAIPVTLLIVRAVRRRRARRGAPPVPPT